MEKPNRENTLRKIHSLSGIIPLGVFLCVHMLLNYTARWGAASYNTTALFMVNLPYKMFLETFIIFLPLLFHAVYGIYIALNAQCNTLRYPYARNWYFVLQRATGIIAFVFVVWHIYTTRLQVAFGAEPDFNMMAQILTNPVFFAFYLVGLLATIFHFVNGIGTFLITWGITISPKSQKVVKYILVIIFFAFSVFGISALMAFV